MANLLFLAHRIPYPPNKGDKIRSYHFFEHLAQDNQMFLGTFIDDPDDWQYLDKLKPMCADSCFIGLNPWLAKIKCVQGLLTGQALSVPYYRSKALQAWVDRVIKAHGIDHVLVFSSVMAQFVECYGDGLTRVVDFVDVDSDKWRQYADKKQGLARWIYRRESRLLLQYERKTAQSAKAGIFVSPEEAELFKQLAGLEQGIDFIYNGVDAERFSPALTFDNPYQPDEKVIVFTGAMDYWANVDAVKWFAEEVFAKAALTGVNVKFYIVGAKPTPDVLALSKIPNVVVTGAVPDVRPFVAHAAWVAAPLRIARGVQNKVLEAMAMAKFIMATPAAMEGIATTEALDVSVSDSAEAMIKTLQTLVQQPAAQISQRNRDFVRTRFGWRQNLQKLSALLQGAA
ncbi:MAG: sugar transferase [Methylobacter sp.]|nr:MAG: sugar transferase [Methylobacter sp.]